MSESKKRVATHPRRQARRAAALLRQEARKQRTPYQQWEILQHRVGTFGAMRERQRLVDLIFP